MGASDSNASIGAKKRTEQIGKEKGRRRRRDGNRGIQILGEKKGPPPPQYIRTDCEGALANLIVRPNQEFLNLRHGSTKTIERGDSVSNHWMRNRWGI